MLVDDSRVELDVIGGGYGSTKRMNWTDGRGSHVHERGRGRNEQLAREDQVKRGGHAVFDESRCGKNRESECESARKNQEKEKKSKLLSLTSASAARVGSGRAKIVRNARMLLDIDANS